MKGIAKKFSFGGESNTRETIRKTQVLRNVRGKNKGKYAHFTNFKNLTAYFLQLYKKSQMKNLER